MTLKCVGKNPRLASAKSKNDKNITGLINSVESGRTIIYNFVNVAPFEIGQPLTNVMDIDFTATEDTTAAFQCEMLLEVIKPEDATADGETEEENPEPELPELSIIYKINNETIDTFMPTKTCLYGKHIMTLFFPISKVIENSSNTFSMYLKISSGSAKIGEAQIRATISGQGLAAGLGDWNGRININENIGNISITDVPFVADVFKDKASVTFPSKKTQGLTQTIGNIPITDQNYEADVFTDRAWITEILRTFVLTSVRGNPNYNGYITVNTEERFMLRKRYVQKSEPESLDHGYAEDLVVDISYFTKVDGVEVNGYTAAVRPQYVITAAETSVKFPDTITVENGFFELKAVTEQTQEAVTDEVDEGFLERTTVDISGFDGVKGVEFIL